MADKRSATTELARILGAATRAMAPAEILAKVHPTVTKPAIYFALSQGTSKGVYRRSGMRGDYRYELASKPSASPTPSESVPTAPGCLERQPEQLRHSVGLVCTPGVALSKGERALASAIESAFGEQSERSLDELVEALGGQHSRSTIKSVLNEFAFAGRLTSRKDGGATLYCLDAVVDGQVEAALTAPPKEGDQLSFAQRLHAVSEDLCHAIEDACDSALPHSVIKHLVAANRATQFAQLGLQG